MIMYAVTKYIINLKQVSFSLFSSVLVLCQIPHTQVPDHEKHVKNKLSGLGYYFLRALSVDMCRIIKLHSSRFVVTAIRVTLSFY